MRPQGNEQEARRNKHVRSAPAKIAVRALGEDALDEILDGAANPLLLILDCVQDPHNLGAILRTADGAGVDAVIAPRDKSVGITETVLRISVGAAEKVPFIQVTNLARTMKQLQSRGIWIFGTSDKGNGFHRPRRPGDGRGRRRHETADGRELRLSPADSHERFRALPERIRGYGRVPV